MKIIFFSNGKFLFKTVKKIQNSNHKIICAISDKAKKKGRGLNLKDTDFAKFAKSLSLPLTLKTDLNNHKFINDLKKYNADVFIVADYKIIPKEIFKIPKYGCINLHPSLLPKYKGAAPIQRAIINGDDTMGITTFIINEKIDSGKIICQEKVLINDKFTFQDIYETLSKIGSDIIIKTLTLLKSNSTTSNLYKYKESYAKKITKNECRIDFSISAKDIHNKIRGLAQLGCYGYINGRRIRLYDSYYSMKQSDLKIGEFKLNNNFLEIGCNKSTLLINSVQLEGKNKITAIDFANNQSITTNIIE